MIPAPAHLSDSARLAWDEITSSLKKLDGIELPGVESYAVAVARRRDAQARIDAEGVIVADGKGQPIPHPALAIERAAAADIRAWLTRYRRWPNG